MFAVKNIPVPQSLDIVVTSFGGVGTTFLLEFLSRYKKVNNVIDEDGLKHSAQPHLSINPSQKFIYIYGNPVHAVISLFRRDFHSPQSRKIQRFLNLNSPIPEEMTLHEYAKTGVEKLGFQPHFFNWYHGSCHNPLLFIRYETLYNHLDEVIKFAGLPSKLIKSFPEKRERESIQLNLPERTLYLLEYMYSDFTETLAKIPDLQIREGQSLTTGKKLLLRKEYYQSLGILNLKKISLDSTKSSIKNNLRNLQYRR